MSRQTVILMLIRNALVLAFAAAALSASAQVEYSLTNLDANGILFPSPGTLAVTSSRALAINNAGQVTGEAVVPGMYITSGLLVSINTHAFRYSNGKMEGLSDFGDFHHGYAINDKGQIAGDGYSGSYTQARLQSPDGSDPYIPFLKGGNQTVATGVNEAGVIVGYGKIPSNDFLDHFEAFLYAGGNVLTGLGTLNLGGTLPNGGLVLDNSFAHAINDRGQVTGNSVHPFFYTGSGGMRDLGTFGGLTGTGYAINESGRVAGGAQNAAGAFRAFLSAPDGGALTDLGTLGGTSSTAYGLNESDTVVGTSTNSSGQNRAFVHLPGVGMRDLNFLLDMTGAGWTLTEATAINDSGLIVGSGIFNGQVHSFLLTPQAVPEPATMAALGLGALAVLRRRRKA